MPQQADFNIAAAGGGRIQQTTGQLPRSTVLRIDSGVFAGAIKTTHPGSWGGSRRPAQAEQRSSCCARGSRTESALRSNRHLRRATIRPFSGLLHPAPQQLLALKGSDRLVEARARRQSMAARMSEGGTALVCLADV